jgi:DNA helicase-2/ATP-dependent DNA helicase PcrA
MIGAGRVEPRPSALGAKRSIETGLPGSPLRVGQSVFHNKFGEGVILTLEGGGADARAQVNFGRHGAKWLALSIAKLTPIPTA